MRLKIVQTCQQSIFRVIQKVLIHLAFKNCLNIKDINIPDSTVQIGNQAFYNCSNLENSQQLATIFRILEQMYSQAVKTWR